MQIKHLLSGFILLGLYSCTGKPIDEKISNMYRRNWGSVYYTNKPNVFIINGNKIGEADANTFVPLAETVGVDKNTVYFKTFPQPHVDRNSFRVNEDGTMRDKDHIYIPSFSDGDESKLKILYGVDTETYRSFKGHVGWGCDKNHVYQGYSKPIEADPGTFVFLSENFMKDKDFVYFISLDGLKRKQMNTAPVIAVNNLYLRDDSRIYFPDLTETADFIEIPFISADNIKLPGDPFIIIDNQVYAKGILLNGGDADASGFEVLDSYYSKDAGHIFCNEVAVASADVAGFEILGNGMAKDKNAAYYWGRKLDGVDPGSLRILNPVYFADDNHVYFIQSGIDKDNFFFIVADADPTTFSCNNNKGIAFGADKKNEYYNGLTIIPNM